MTVASNRTDEEWTVRAMQQETAVAEEGILSPHSSSVFKHCQISSQGGRATPTVEAKIEKTHWTALIDTGSPRSVISIETWRQIKDRASFEGQQRILRDTTQYKGPPCVDVQGQPLTIQFCATLNVEVGGENIRLTFLVVRAGHMSTAVLFGTDALGQLKATLQIGGKGTQFSFYPGDILTSGIEMNDTKTRTSNQQITFGAVVCTKTTNRSFPQTTIQQRLRRIPQTQTFPAVNNSQQNKDESQRPKQQGAHWHYVQKKMGKREKHWQSTTGSRSRSRSGSSSQSSDEHGRSAERHRRQRPVGPPQQETCIPSIQYHIQCALR